MRKTGSRPRCRAAILISGSGTNLQAFIDRIADNSIDLDLSGVFSNRADAFGLVRARTAGIPTACIEHQDFSDREQFDQVVADKLDEWRPDLLILAGFMRILSASFVRHFLGRIINIHPALLPAYTGLNTHQRVLDAGDAWHGSTVHFVTDELDGGPRVLQGRLAINRDETATQLATRIQTIEHQIYPLAASWFAAGRLAYVNGEAWLDGTRLSEPVCIDYDENGRCKEPDQALGNVTPT